MVKETGNIEAENEKLAEAHSFDLPLICRKKHAYVVGDDSILVRNFQK